MSLDKKREYLELLNKRIMDKNKEIHECRHVISNLNRKERTRKLIIAGSLFEKAGILDDYDSDTVLNLLKTLKKRAD